jgi:methionine-rich copper-binding protein CopC
MKLFSGHIRPPYGWLAVSLECCMHRLVARAGLVIAFAATCVSPALAHAFLTTAIPAVGSTVATSPSEVDCNFTEALEPSFSTLEVQNAAGARVDTGKMHLAAGDAKRMVIGVQHLPAGTYTVTWHATSVDTHHTAGHFNFTVAP